MAAQKKGKWEILAWWEKPGVGLKERKRLSKKQGRKMRVYLSV